MSNTLTAVLVASLQLAHLATESLGRFSGRTSRSPGLAQEAPGSDQVALPREGRVDPRALWTLLIGNGLTSMGVSFFLPILPLYIALEKIDPRLIEAAEDLYASSWQAFRRVTLPLALPGVFAGTILTFIPTLGDYVNAELLGSPKTRMIGNVIQGRFLQLNDYPVASALSFVLMASILVAVLAYARALGTEQLTG